MLVHRKGDSPIGATCLVRFPESSTGKSRGRRNSYWGTAVSSFWRTTVGLFCSLESVARKPEKSSSQPRNECRAVQQPPGIVVSRISVNPGGSRTGSAVLRVLVEFSLRDSDMSEIQRCSDRALLDQRVQLNFGDP